MNIVFDIGNVLVRWDARAAFPQSDADEWLERIGFAAWNLEQDRGRSFADGLAVLAPADRARMAPYLDRFATTIAQPMEGTWALVERLRAAGRSLYAITNWGRETWPIGVATHPRLATAFRDVVVSGVEGVLKPDPEIFAILCRRNGLIPGECLFIDDSEKNVAGARAFGMQAHHFTSPEVLAGDLTGRGLM